MLEDVNTEHLLDVFTSIDTDLDNVWDACHHFMEHLFWHKPRLVALGPKIEGLPDDHPSKPECLFELSRLFDSVGNHVEAKRLLIHTLDLWRGRGDDINVADILLSLADVNRLLDLDKEGIQQVEEALEIYERHNNIRRQGDSLQRLARLLCCNNGLDAAEAAASRAIDLFLGEGDQFEICQCHHVLGDICHSKGETKKAMDHLETALRIAASFNWHDPQFWILYNLAEVFHDQGKFDDAHAHLERAMSHVVNNAYPLARAMELRAVFWYTQHWPEEAKSEALRALDAYEKLGATKDTEGCRKLLQQIEAIMN
jgi:tetratricopeptide (TPR) repeat protein